MTRRCKIYLAVTFALTWSFWGILIPLARTRVIVYGQAPFMLLYALGGLGPTIAAYVAVLSTRRQSPLSEFHRRLYRWRVPSSWYAVAVGLPVAIALAALQIAVRLHPDSASPFPTQPWYMFVPLFFFMIAGGGLEELGWRGVAQPELERSLRRPIAAALVGLIWAMWHLPLFVLPGVSQYRTSFPVFAVQVVGLALILAWLYGHTASILLCIALHAGKNAIWALGLGNPSIHDSVVLLDACLSLLTGAVLLAVKTAGPKKPSTPLDA